MSLLVTLILALLLSLIYVYADSGWYSDVWDALGAAAVGGARENTTWSTRIVIAPAVWEEWEPQNGGVPAWVSDANLTTYLYQRKNASLPRYVPNNGFEAGIYLRFIVDHYDNLPHTTVLVQGDVPHNGSWLHWVRCLLPSSDLVMLPSRDPSGPSASRGNTDAFYKYRNIFKWYNKYTHIHTPDRDIMTYI
jgi:hypothetical protein